MNSLLLNVPNEILTHVAFHLSALSLRALPDPLLPLRCTSAAMNARLSPSQNPALYARICRLKFDDSAVRRRAFSPDAMQYTSHLLHCYQTLGAVQNRNFDDNEPDSVLFHVFILMLDNDGKNRAQLEWAGIDAYVGAYFRTRMYDPIQRMSNNGWPVDSAANACALWLMWMLTTPEKLEAESPAEREQVALSVLPYASIPFRYASAHAPAIHFNLPLQNPANNVDNNLFSIQTAHGHYPIYRSPNRAWSQIYYSSRPLVMHPLAAEAAKLIYQSRRDLALLHLPPQFPRTRADAIAAGWTQVIPTHEDVDEVNTHKSARLVKRIIWDWDRDVGIVPGTNDGAEYVEASRAWDCDWWRLRVCWDVWRPQPRFRPGRVYAPGTLSGLWQGKMMIPSEVSMMEFLNHTLYPGTLFTEEALTITSRPIFMRLAEHHYTASHSGEPISNSISTHPQQDGVQNAWFEGQPGSLFWHTTVGHGGERGVRLHTEFGNATEYRTYEPPNDGTEWTGHSHDRERCPQCTARSAVIACAKEAEFRKWDEEERSRLRQIEQTFASVGLGQDMGAQAMLGNQDMEVEDEEADDEGLDDIEDDANELDIMAEEGSVSLAGQDLSPTPRAHDWFRNVMECDGIRDIIVTGATDESHGQAWQHYTYYGRVRPWDGLIGILRVPRNPVQGMVVLYGYISGGKNFSGNWRHSVADPLMPAWECAVVMSKRDEFPTPRS